MTIVLHVISGLQTGGAENMLLNLVRATRKKIDHHVVSLTTEGDLGESFRKAGASVKAVRMSRKTPNPFVLLRLAHYMRLIRPEAVHTWMYHGDLIGGIAARLARIDNILWHVHHTDLDPELDGRRTMAVARLCAKLSGVVPRRTIFCSQRARDHHEGIGYRIANTQVVYNGFDLRDNAESHQDATRIIRHQHGVPNNAILILHVGGFRPQKDHATLLEAARMVTETDSRIHFLLCGPGVSIHNPAFKKRHSRQIDNNQIHVLGQVDDIGFYQKAVDFAVLSSSHGEAFPLVLGEAMVRGTPCISTDVGDAGEIIGDSGRLVPPRDPRALANAITEMCDLDQKERTRLSGVARARIVERFSIDEMAATFLNLYRNRGKEIETDEEIRTTRNVALN